MTTHQLDQPPRVAYIGNFGPAHSTENHVAETLRRMGCEVVTLQENDPAVWRELGDVDDAHSGVLAGMWPDVMLWTRTGWDPPVPADVQLAMLESCRRVGVPTVGFHLDRWWGLARQGQVDEQPFFRCDLVATADGGHDDEWHAAGVNHMWLAPAVAEWQCGWGTPDRSLASDVAFVGSWNSYHPEWPWRRQLVRQLQARFGNRRFRCWPEVGQSVRGDRLRNLYASATVVVGDSCLVGSPRLYWSDRVPETLGRGGLLIHPHVDGLEAWYEDGADLLLVEQENIADMIGAVEHVLAMPVDEQYEIRRHGMATVLAGHTYRHRMLELLDAVANLEVAS